VALASATRPRMISFAPGPVSATTSSAWIMTVAAVSALPVCPAARVSLPAPMSRTAQIVKVEMLPGLGARDGLGVPGDGQDRPAGVVARLA
jgi:hypothetical protein